MNHDPISGERVSDHPKGSMLLADSMVTLVKGIVHSQQVGLLHPTVRIRAGRRVDMRITLALDDDRCFFPGQPVIAKIPAEAVRLEAGLFRRSRQRLNRWYGRIVLIKPLVEGQTVTAKVHGESWALASSVPVLGSTTSARTWDSVNIVVDPQRIELFPGQRAAPLGHEAPVYGPH
ncbi:MAG: hypothetical protein H8K04_05970 [Nitrospira sp.]